MKTAVNRYSLVAGLLIAFGLMGGSARAEFPEKQISIVVPFSPGGVTDVLGRLIGEGISSRLKQPVLIENRTGAGSMVGLEYFSRAPADGYVLFLVNPATAALTVLFNDVRVDPSKVIAPVSLIATGEIGLVGTGTLPIRNWAEFVAYGKANPGKLSYGNVGGFVALLGDYMVKRDNLDAVSVRYRGSSDVQQALVAGTLSVGIITATGLEAFTKDGRLKILAVSGRKRSASLPEVQTITEAGFSELDAAEMNYFGIGAPTGTPRAVIQRLNEVIADVVRSPAYRQRVASFDYEPVSSTPEKLGEVFFGSIRKWSEVARKINYKPEAVQ